MPMSYRIDRAAGIIRISGDGTLTDEDMIACIAALREDGDLRPGMPTLSDMRDVSSLEISPAGIVQMLRVMDRTSGRRGDAKAAIVVSRDLAFGMGRMLASIGEAKHATPRFRVFRDLEAALTWIKA